MPLPVTAYVKGVRVSIVFIKVVRFTSSTYLDDDILVATEEVECGLLDRSGLLIAHRRYCIQNPFC